VNIWSHLLGFVFFVGIGLSQFVKEGKDNYYGDDFIFELVASTLVLFCFQVSEVIKE